MDTQDASKKRARESDGDEDDAPKRSKVAEDGAERAGTTNAPGAKRIDDEEAQLYDRQMRLWGLDGQQRWSLGRLGLLLSEMRNVKILVIGMKALSNEVVKNTVLAGVGGITILDPENVEPHDLGAQFFLRESDIGWNRAEAVAERVSALNPRVKIEAVTEPISKLGDEFFDSFSVVCATGLDMETLKRVNKICRDKGIKFYAADQLGFHGYYFCDLIEHQYTRENKELAYGTEIVTKETISESYVPLQDALEASFEGLADRNDRKFGKLRFAASPLFFAIMTLLRFRQKHGRYPNPESEDDDNGLVAESKEYLKLSGVPENYVPEELVRTMAHGAGTEINPVAAIIGGQLAQDILKVISGKDAPINNFFCFSGRSLAGYSHKLPPAIEKAKKPIETIDLDDD
ncbi:hypothetical protein DFJ74DRAFT_705073 [Hyaloraphidium curvatum]|nr:hypothetical protein DFJ74DRAFT_705073 [Hyaloraphidium curvatum]